MLSLLEFHGSTYFLAILFSLQFVTMVNPHWELRIGRSISMKRNRSFFFENAMIADRDLLAMVTTSVQPSNPDVPKDPNCNADHCGR